MRIAVITDAHENLPALEAALRAIGAEGCDAIYHTGDAIAIGPYPAECLELLFHTPNIHFVVGNHETYLLDGLPKRQPAWMYDNEVEHQLWTHSRLDPQIQAELARWPYRLEHDFGGVMTLYVHYGLAPSGQGFLPVIQDAKAVDLDKVFARQSARLVFYGHNHRASDVKGRARYVNPGSLGCHSTAIARYCVADFHRGQYRATHRGVPYDDTRLPRAFERRGVPAREFIYRAFFGGPFRTESDGGN
jgi:predicted phosphodiesterase